MLQPKIILIAGPTASGKSALALEIARGSNGTIINADAMQVYAGLPILTAQPSESECREVPHELYGVLDPSESSSAGKWVALAKRAIAKTIDNGRTPILVGGTGMYFRALLGGLADIPEIPGEVREKAEKLYAELGEEEFRRELARLDPESARRLEKNDRQRLIRAYEVAAHTGKPIIHWQKNTPENYLEFFSIEPHLLLPERTTLYAACDRRFAGMIEQGAVDEVRAFLARNLNAELPAMKTLGVREIGAYLRNEMPLDESIAKAQQATRNYAKRQMTWFRNQWAF
ncbi:MAG: tRNA (adenosine(37)-N6)-dimethylallyltransferase MiaA [Alphaproteobacteria bacterium]|nr:tRNA (adenosine(37)-N6)-dimethylallyltransferase MiaA [Alphaproteobacteria bacterium]